MNTKRIQELNNILNEANDPDFIHIKKDSGGYSVYHSKHESPNLGGQGLKHDLSKSEASKLATKLSKKWKAKIIDNTK